MNRLTNLFQDEITQLKSKSSNIVDVFTKTITDLNNVNNEIELAQKERNEKVAKLISEQEELDKVFTSNSKVIGKLNSILND